MNSRISQAIFLTLISLAIGIGLGQGCARPYQSSSSSNAPIVDMSSNLPSEYVPDPNAETLSVVYNKQVLDHLVSCSGVGVPSDATQATWSAKRGAISIDGTVLTITAPMLMAVSTIAGDVCRDLIDQEKLSPRLFNNVNWSATALPADNALYDAIRGLALSCWQRQEDNMEQQVIIDAVKSEFSSGNIDPSTAYLFLCTSMLGSLDTLIL